MRVIDSIPFRGNRCGRFEIREDQPLVKNGKRSEIVVIKGLPSREMWYSFAVYFPERGFETDRQREVICQWYQDGSPATSLRVQNNVLFLETGPTLKTRRRLDIAPITKNEWHEVVFHFLHAPDATGFIEVWYDAKKVITHSGGNMYDDVLPKWKIGLYKAAFEHGTSDVTKRVVFFDNIKVGSDKASYTLMEPSAWPVNDARYK